MTDVGRVSLVLQAVLYVVRDARREGFGLNESVTECRKARKGFIAKGNRCS